MADVHKTALVHPKAQLAENVQVSPYAIIEEGVTIDENSWIGPHVLLAKGSKIGKGCRIFTGAVIGTIPQDLKFEGEETSVEIGDRTVVREYCTLNRGTKDRMKSQIGENCLLMA
ncbi:MAG TPA: acyl-[acyl-carrier-protein]--UDP-N-acetylglucosamine O-acyltransferase, partial [Bacteroidetes bacterium]|nr:acyl-[acyl-carrier-protein]--UDP-N-acetylglucosamine O-acyltransferase [Bacteroidota bacterium]